MIYKYNCVSDNQRAKKNENVHDTTEKSRRLEAPPVTMTLAPKEGVGKCPLMSFISSAVCERVAKPTDGGS
jgi:hypothetical protein